MNEIKNALSTVCKDLFSVDVRPELTRPDEQFGDYATNVALQLAKQLNKKPHEVAETIADHVKRQSSHIKKVEVAGAGFINITLTDKALWQLTHSEPVQALAGKTIIVEYSDPNPFKELHVGHLYDSILGEAIAILNETAGAKVHRVNFGGDVGLHVAKAMWGIIKELKGERPEGLQKIPSQKRAKWLSARYVEGANTYEADDNVKEEIKKLNHRIYIIHNQKDHTTPLAQIYWVCRKWSYDYFNDFYKRLGIKFDKYYPESTTVEPGLEAVKQQLTKGVFKKSDGAIIFAGETHNLHTRVFINSNGLPTYETKDIGLALSKWQDYHFDQNIIITGSDIIEYMKVVLAALKQFEPEIATRTTHVTHGMVKLKSGAKMSSRKGNVLRAVDVIEMTAEASNKISNNNDKQVVHGAIKYAFLKQRYITDIIYDPKESVSIEGNSGPYLQYAHARARSILKKSQTPNTKHQTEELEDGERSLLRKISEYSEVVDKAIEELMPHHICTYLYELAQTFNSFYEKNRVVGDPREHIRTQLVKSYASTLKNGLGLLNISAPEKM